MDGYKVNHVWGYHGIWAFQQCIILKSWGPQVMQVFRKAGAKKGSLLTQRNTDTGIWTSKTWHAILNSIKIIYIQMIFDCLNMFEILIQTYLRDRLRSFKTMQHISKTTVSSVSDPGAGLMLTHFPFRSHDSHGHDRAAQAFDLCSIPNEWWFNSICFSPNYRFLGFGMFRICSRRFESWKYLNFSSVIMINRH